MTSTLHVKACTSSLFNPGVQPLQSPSRPTARVASDGIVAGTQGLGTV